MILRNHSYCRSIILLVTFIFLLTACTSTTTNTISQQDPTANEQVTESVEDGQTLTVVTPETADKAPEEKSKYQIQTRLTDFHMLSESEGIAWGVTKGALRLYLTEDFGETWVDISPSSNIQFKDKLVYGHDIVFTDKDHGWIVRNGGSEGTMLMNTSDGGKEWKLSSLPDAEEITGLSFTSSMNGWVMASAEATSSWEEKNLFRTNDQGEHWTRVMENSNYAAISEPGTVIPRTGLIREMTFANSYTGFATVKETKGSKLYISRDGGVSWSASKDIFQDDQSKLCESYIPGVPQFLGSANDVWVSITCLNDGDPEFGGYFSTDSGLSWEFVSFPLNPKSMQGTISPVFRRQHEGWSVINGIVYRSKDMGETWTPYPRDPELAKHLAEYPIISKMEFASSDVGWMLVETVDEKRSRLLLSMDGGATWRIR